MYETKNAYFSTYFLSTVRNRSIFDSIRHAQDITERLRNYLKLIANMCLIKIKFDHQYEVSILHSPERTNHLNEQPWNGDT